MRALLLAALVLIPFAPTVAADDVCSPLMIPLTACVMESSWSDGDCAEGGFEGGGTAVVVDAPGVVAAGASGSGYCYGNNGENSVFASVWTPVEARSVSWTEFWYSDPENGEFRQCFVASGAIFQTCPPGLVPPNPGWGQLLP